MDILSQKEIAELKDVHPALVAVVLRAFERVQGDYYLFDGIRTKAEQRNMVRRGVSKTMKSYHLKQADGWGHAVDIIPMVNGKVGWPNEAHYWEAINEAMTEAGKHYGVPLTNGYAAWGWDRPHWQIPRTFKWKRKTVGNRPVKVPPGTIGEDPQKHFEEALGYVLKHEGGYVNDPKDPGGPTNRGINIFTLQRWRKRPMTARDVQSLTLMETKQIYDAYYWDSMLLDDVPKGVDYAMFSCGVLAGTGTAVRFCQKVVGAQVDGRMGKLTIAAIKKYVDANGKDVLIEKFCSAWLKYLKGRKGWARYGRGWGRRVKEVREVGKVMAKRDKFPDPDRPIVTEPNAPSTSLWGKLKSFWRNW